MQGKKRLSIGMNPILLGFCDGVANYCSVNVWLVRLLLFVILYMITGSLMINFILYVLIAFLMPQKKTKSEPGSEYRTKN
jgi:phage shock protein PspC (stress-responsive transcriptional regulator)